MGSINARVKISYAPPSEKVKLKKDGTERKAVGHYILTPLDGKTLPKDALWHVEGSILGNQCAAMLKLNPLPKVYLELSSVPSGNFDEDGVEYQNWNGDIISDITAAFDTAVGQFDNIFIGVVEEPKVQRAASKPEPKLITQPEEKPEPELITQPED
jgi:hypothetical protein